MRVAHVIKVTGIAGAERHLLVLLRGLCRSGVDAHLILLVQPDNPMDSMVAEAAARDIPVERIVIRADYDLPLINRLRKRFTELRPDIVHTHLLHADVFGIPAAWLARVPVILTSRHNDDPFRRHFMMRGVNGLLWRMVRAGVAISDSIRRFVINYEYAPPEKVSVVRYGLEYDWISDAGLNQARLALREELDLPPESLLLGMVCRLVEQKGVTYAIKAFHQIAPLFPDAHLVIAGDGPLRAALEAQTDSLDLSNRIHFLGWREDALTILSALDIFLMPSLWEGFGLVMLESMSRRTPVIASQVSAIPEVIQDGVSGILVPPGDAESLAQAIYNLLLDRPARLHMGLLGEDRLETYFNVDRMVEEMAALYRRFVPVDEDTKNS